MIAAVLQENVSAPSLHRHAFTERGRVRPKTNRTVAANGPRAPHPQRYHPYAAAAIARSGETRCNGETPEPQRRGRVVALSPADRQTGRGRSTHRLYAEGKKRSFRDEPMRRDPRGGIYA